MNGHAGYSRWKGTLGVLPSPLSMPDPEGLEKYINFYKYKTNIDICVAQLCNYDLHGEKAVKLTKIISKIR